MSLEMWIAFVLIFVSGAIVGAVAMFFIYHNNQKKFDGIIETKEKEFNDLKQQISLDQLVAKKIQEALDKAKGAS